LFFQRKPSHAEVWGPSTDESIAPSSALLWVDALADFSRVDPVASPFRSVSISRLTASGEPLEPASTE
jgi:hypothetical protein